MRIKLFIIFIVILICSALVNAEGENSIMNFISSPNLTFPLILILIIIVITITIKLVKDDNLSKNKLHEKNIKKEDNEKKLQIHKNTIVNQKKGKFQIKIAQYIAQASEIHISDGKIISNLLKVGWKEEDIKKTFETLNKL